MSTTTDYAEIAWGEFFDELEKRKLALMCDEERLLSKMVGRDTTEHGAHVDRRASR